MPEPLELVEDHEVGLECTHSGTGERSPQQADKGDALEPLIVIEQDSDAVKSG